MTTTSSAGLGPVELLGPTVPLYVDSSQRVPRSWVLFVLVHCLFSQPTSCVVPFCLGAEFLSWHQGWGMGLQTIPSRGWYLGAQKCGGHGNGIGCGLEWELRHKVWAGVWICLGQVAAAGLLNLSGPSGHRLCPFPCVTRNGATLSYPFLGLVLIILPSSHPELMNLELPLSPQLCCCLPWVC